MRGPDPDDEAAVLARQAAWANALQTDSLLDFVTKRLKAASERRAPWLSTMTPPELLLGKSRGLRPLGGFATHLSTRPAE